MRKRGQFNSEIILYALIVIVAVVIFALGAKFIGKMMSDRCRTQIDSIAVDLVTSAEALKGKAGSTESMKFSPPCDVDAIYFVDADNSVPYLFDYRPEVQSAIDDGTGDNIFFYKDNQVVKVIKAQIDMPFPYFLCATLPHQGQFEMTLTGAANGMAVNQVNRSKLCNPFPAEIVSEDANLVELGEFLNFTAETVKDNYNSVKPGIETPWCQVSQSRKSLRIFIGYHRELQDVDIYHKVNNALLSPTIDIQPDVLYDPSHIQLVSGPRNTCTPEFLKYHIDATPDADGIIVIGYEDLPVPIPEDVTGICDIMIFENNHCSSDSECILDGATICRYDDGLYGNCGMPSHLSQPNIC